MKKFFAIVMAMVTMAVNTSTVFAEELDTVAVKEEITATDYAGSDSSEFGKLVAHTVLDNGDGTYTEEFLYVKPADTVLYGMENSDTATYTKKTNRYQLQQILFTSYVSATFSWDTGDKTVYVLDTDGWMLDNGNGYVPVDEKITVKGDASRKASVTYSVKAENKYGTQYSDDVTVSCDYTGKCI